MPHQSQIETITSPALRPLTHGFFTRKGGASSGIFAGLNCGTGSSDLAEAVQINRSRVAEAMGAPPQGDTSAALISVHQIHSPDVAVINGPHDGAPPRADAMVTDRPGLILGILTADCQPVLFADAEAGVIGAAHAGWRGTRDGVLEATLEAMERLGATRGRITAVIGPTISQAAYEVGPEFVRAFTDGDPQAEQYFAPGRGDRALFDLPAYALARLRMAGIGQAEWTGHCTYSDPARFYSYRRTTHAGEADYGRLISCIRL